MPLLTADKVQKSYDHKRVLEEVSLAIEPGDRVGLIGANGSGKSTLAKILAGIELPDDGTVARRRDASFAYLAQEPALDPNKTAFEVVEEGLTAWSTARRAHAAVSAKLAAGEGDIDALLREQSRLATEVEHHGGWEQSHRIDAMLKHLGIVRSEQVIGTMSGGERRRVALAQLLVAKPSLAILDEPTNHLDTDTVEWLEEHLLTEFPGALLLIIHDRYFLDRVVTRVLEIDRGRAMMFEGNYERFVELKSERLEHENRVEANRLNLLRREREWLSHKAPARTRKQKARIDRAAALEKAVRDDRRSNAQVSLAAAAVQSGKRLIELKGVARTLGGRTLFSKLDLFLGPGERLGIVGRNGAGKTSLVKVILGEDKPDEGEVVVGNQTRMSYFDQGRVALDDRKTVYENLFEGSDKVRVGKDWMPLPAYLDRFMFDGTKQHQAVGNLSGGERARVSLAKMLRGDANLLVLDEPTNDLDLITLASLEEMLTTFDGSVIVVTHDRYFLNRIATSILAFEGDGRVIKYAGDYDDYRSQRAQLDEERELRAAMEREERAKAEKASAPAKKDAQRKTLTMAEVKELDALPGLIEESERAIAQLEAQLNDPTLYASRGSEVAPLQAKLKAAQDTLEARMLRWEALESKKG